MLANSNNSNTNRGNYAHRVDRRAHARIGTHVAAQFGEPEFLHSNVISGLHRHTQKYHAGERRANKLSRVCSH